MKNSETVKSLIKRTEKWNLEMLGTRVNPEDKVEGLNEDDQVAKIEIFLNRQKFPLWIKQRVDKDGDKY